MPGSAVLVRVGLLWPLLLSSARGFSPATSFQRWSCSSYIRGAGEAIGTVSSSSRLEWAGHVSMRLGACEGGHTEGGKGGNRARGSGVSRRQQHEQQAGLVAACVVGAWGVGGRPAVVEAKAVMQAPSAYYPQVLQGYSTLRSLVSDKGWAEVSVKGGDEIRRRLGTVGTASPLFRLNKALDGLREGLLEIDDGTVDILAMADTSAALLSGLTNADFLAYSSNFSSYGNGGGGTDYLEESHKAMAAALTQYTELLDILHLEPPK